MKAPLQNPEEQEYYLSRDVNETLRLHAQHHAIVLRSGWLLHPKVQESLSEVKEPQIADVACGSGIWTFEVAQKFPTAIVTGLDVSAKQFPPEWSWPKNGKLDTLDLCGEVPPKYRGKFDIVHCRLLLGAGPTVDATIFTDAFLKMLKPGGWLQWQELQYPTVAAFEPTRDHVGAITGYKEVPFHMEAMARLCNLEYKCGPSSNFREWMSKNTSFQNVEQIDQPASPNHARLDTDSICSAVSTAVNGLLQDQDLNDATKDELRENAALGEKLKAAGMLCSHRLAVCLAQAPGR